MSGRDEKQKILVVVSDGTAGDSFNENAQALKDMAVSIYFVGMARSFANCKQLDPFLSNIEF